MLLSRSVGFCPARIVCYLKPKLRVRGLAVSKNLVIPMEAGQLRINLYTFHFFSFFFCILSVLFVGLFGGAGGQLSDAF